MIYILPWNPLESPFQPAWGKALLFSAQIYIASHSPTFRVSSKIICAWESSWREPSTEARGLSLLDCLSEV